MEWSTRDVTEMSGVTSRALRHYHAIGLLNPARVGPGGIRYYRQEQLLRLQQILVLKELGLSLGKISKVLEGQLSDAKAFHELRACLETERDRITRQLVSVETAIRGLKNNEEIIMPEKIFDGFDRSEYDTEVRERWGDAAADRSNEWWDRLGQKGQQEIYYEVEKLNSQWDDRVLSGESADSERTQTVAERHVAWISANWNGVPVTGKALKGLAEMYVEDERFAANYTRVADHGAQYVRDALVAYADRHLP